MKIENISKAKEIINSIEDIDKFIININRGSMISLISANNTNIATIQNEYSIKAISDALCNERKRLLDIIKEL